MIRANRTILAILLLLSLSAAMLSAARAAVPISVNSVSVTPNLSSLTINGTNFVQAGLALQVTLDGYAAPLALSSVTTTQIQAALPAGVPPGNYLLAVVLIKSGKVDQSDEAWITLGAVGPPGPQGIQGPPGAPGPQGPAGAGSPDAAALVAGSERGRAYTSNTSNAVRVIDTRARAAIGTIPISFDAVGIDLNPAGTRLWVGSHDPLPASLWEIDTTNAAVVGSVPLGTTYPLSVKVSPLGDRVYVGGGGSIYGQPSSVIVVDTRTRSIIASIPVPSDPWGLAFSPSGDRVYAVGSFSDTVTVINTATNTVVQSIPGMINAVSIAVDPRTGRGYVPRPNATIAVIDFSTATVSSIALPEPTGEIQINPSTRRAYVSTGSGTLHVIDIDAGVVTKSLAPGGYLRAISFNAEGTRGYVSTGSGAVLILDAINDVVLGEIPADGNHAYKVVVGR